MTFNERRLLHQLSPHLQARVTNLANAGLIRQVRGVDDAPTQT
jgi:hypothetical protein